MSQQIYTIRQTNKPLAFPNDAYLLLVSPSTHIQTRQELTQHTVAQANSIKQFCLCLKVFSLIILSVALIHALLGTEGEVLIGAHWPIGLVKDATIDSQDRFYGVAFALYAAVLWQSSSDLQRFSPILKSAFIVFFLSGCARFIALGITGVPSKVIIFLWSLELISPPLLMWWHSRLIVSPSTKAPIEQL